MFSFASKLGMSLSCHSAMVELMFENWTLTNISNRKWVNFMKQKSTNLLFSQGPQIPMICRNGPSTKISTKGGCSWSPGQTTGRCRTGLIYAGGFKWILGWRNFCWRNLRKVYYIYIYKADATHVTCASALNHCNFDWKMYSIMGNGEVFQILCVCRWNFHAPG